MGSVRGVLVGATACALLWSGAVAASAGADERGVDPHQGESLVEVHLESKAAAVRLQLEAERYGVDFNEHYLRRADDGSATVTVFGTDDEIAALDAAGFEVGVTIEGRSTWRNRLARTADRRRQGAAARTTRRSTSPWSRRARTRTSSSCSAPTTSRTTRVGSSPSRRRRGSRR